MERDAFLPINRGMVALFAVVVVEVEEGGLPDEKRPPICGSLFPVWDKAWHSLFIDLFTHCSSQQVGMKG